MPGAHTDAEVEVKLVLSKNAAIVKMRPLRDYFHCASYPEQSGGEAGALGHALDMSEAISLF